MRGDRKEVKDSLMVTELPHGRGVISYGVGKRVGRKENKHDSLIWKGKRRNMLWAGREQKKQDV